LPKEDKKGKKSNSCNERDCERGAGFSDSPDRKGEEEQVTCLEVVEEIVNNTNHSRLREGRTRLQHT